MKNEEVLYGVKEENNILHTMKLSKANFIGHMCRRNCLLEHVNEGRIEETISRGRRSKQLVDYPKYKRINWNLTEFERRSTRSYNQDNSL